MIFMTLCINFLSKALKFMFIYIDAVRIVVCSITCARIVLVRSKQNTRKFKVEKQFVSSWGAISNRYTGLCKVLLLLLWQNVQYWAIKKKHYGLIPLQLSHLCNVQRLISTVLYQNLFQFTAFDEAFFEACLISQNIF